MIDRARGRKAAILTPAVALVLAGLGIAATEPVSAPREAGGLEALCTIGVMREVAASIGSSAVTLHKTTVQPGPFLTDGVRYTPAKGDLPAYCQVTGSYVTNPETGKTSSFLATLPENWNGKYLQFGCGGHCGTFAVNNAAFFTITITNQGLPGDILKKGYASFGTDQGHDEMTGATWAVDPDGKVDKDHVEDFLWRSNRVLTQVGKEFTRAFYARASGSDRQITRSYFSGCSGGGRDALVAASYFPEEFDGIIAGSPYSFNMTPLFLGSGLATLRNGGSRVSDAQFTLMDGIISKQCDALDGVEDGLIQNPAMCDFRPERDLPKCEAGQSGDSCFTQGQVEAISATISAVTDEKGNIVTEGFSVSNFLGSYQPPAAPADPEADRPWPDDQMRGGLYALADSAMKVFVHDNDPAFASRRIVSYGSDDPIGALHIVVPRTEVELWRSRVRMGMGHFPENFDKFIRQDRKLMIWHNLSDDKLPPFTSFTLYKQLAKRHGGYGKLRENVRLFSLPGTAHCSGGGKPGGPGSFDALAAMEAWVEQGAAPNALIATLYQPTPLGSVDFQKPLGRTMPLCAFPEMARYKVKGDVNDAANWECPRGDKRMLKIGESGRRAGLLK